MKNSFVHTIFRWLVIMVFSLLLKTQASAQFQKLYGNGQDNYFTKIIPYGQWGFYLLGIEDNYATITRTTSSGQQIWTRKLSVPSGLTDAVLDPNTNDLVFVGFTLPFDNANKSIIGVVTLAGAISSIIAYDTPGAEALTNIVVNPGATTYSVLGFHSPGGVQETVLLQLNSNLVITSKKRFIGPDARFANSLEVYAPSSGIGTGFLVAGAWGTTGVIYHIDNTGALINGILESDPYTFQTVADGGGDIFAALRSTTGASPRLMRLDANMTPLWDVELTGMDDLYQIVVGGGFGDLYALGTGTVNGFNRAIVVKINDIGNGPTLTWARYIGNSESNYIDGAMAPLLLGDIAYADGRTSNGIGFGQNDGFLAKVDGNLGSNCTFDANITLQAHNAVWNSPDNIDLLPYDPPTGLDIGISAPSWQQVAACGANIPVLSCGDISALVEPDQSGRSISYGGVDARGDGVKLVFAPAEGTVFPVGVTTVVATATDASGGTATCSFTVTVEKMPYDSLQPPPNFTLEGMFDRVRDRFGNPYRLGDLHIPDTLSGSLLCVNSGYFNLYFESGCGMEGTSAEQVARRDVLCQLFSDLSDFIIPANPETKVNIWVRDISRVQGVPNPATAGVFGLGTSFYTMPPGVGGIVEGEIWKTINSGADSYTGLVSPFEAVGGAGAGFFHGMLAFNFANPGIDWHTELTSATDSSLYDLYTVALREATHALGFTSLIRPGGQSVFGPVLPGYFSRYDTYLQNATGEPLITPSGTCSLYDYQFNPEINPGVLQPDSSDCLVNLTVCAMAMQFAGTVNQKVYTPNCFEPGRSLSHLEDICRTPSAQFNDQYYVMSNGTGGGSNYQKRFLKPEERQVLCDIGYKVAKTYGHAGQLTFTNYIGGTCPGLGVAGVSDGITSAGTYAYATNVSTPIAIDDILANDYQAVSFECLQVIAGGGTVSTSSGIAFTYTPSGEPGTALLRYVPVGGNGQRGNITYIIVALTPAPCPVAVCNLLGDGGFEQSINCGPVINPPASSTTSNLICWKKLTSTPDLYVRTCANPTFALPNATNPNTWNGGSNNNYLGLYAKKTTTYEDYESVESLLSTPITTGNYTISFRARMYHPGFGNTFILIAGSAATLPAVGWAFTPMLPSVTVFQPAIQVVDNGQWNLITANFYYNGPPLYNLVVANYPSATPISPERYVLLDDIQITFHPTLPTFNPLSTACLNGGLVNLSTAVSPAGGTFSGPGVSGNNFNPNAAGLGAHIITYTVVDGTGCPVSITATIQVVAPPTVIFNLSSTPVCQTAAPVSLTGAVSPPGGTFSGPGMSGNIFNPNTAGPGTHVITYTATNGSGCTATATATIHVLAAANATLTPPPGPICLNSAPIDLNAFASPVGGTFSGSGVLNNSFYALSVGIGPHTITYTYGVVPCQSTVTAVFNVMRCDACDISNHCLDFDGANDFVTAPNPLNTPVLQNNFTVACWFKDDLPATAPATTYYRIYGMGWDKRFELGDKNGNLTFLTATSTAYIRGTGWRHAVAVNANGLVTVYLDGQPVPGLIGLNIGVLSGPPVNLVLGRWAFGAQAPWQGRVDEFKIWNTALTQAQIQDEMQCSLDPANAKLLLHYPFDQYVANGNNAGGTVVNNLGTAGSSSNGTLTNFTLNGNASNWVDRGRDLLPDCNVNYFGWLEGGSGTDIPGRTKVYDADIFTAGIDNFGQNLPVFTRRHSDGSIVWRCVINRPGFINDFIRTDGGCYLLVGHLGSYAGDNRSFIAQIDQLGALTWLDEYNIGQRESFTRIIRSDNPNPAAYPYIACGITTTNAALGYDNILLFNLDAQGKIYWMNQIGNIANTDSEFRYDLMNYAGGYQLAGHYITNTIRRPVLFRTNNLGNQLPSSTQYQPNLIFLDVEPASTGTDLIIAGQLTTTGDAILAKVDAAGVPIWGRIFPRLTSFQKIVVRPNGDIFTVGQRDAVGQYRNVIVKVQDLPGGPVVAWQKHAEMTWQGENNWTAADLVWYSGNKFFFTDGRIGHYNGWGNEDIGALMYELDRPVDTCPVTKEIPLANNFTLVQTPMPTLPSVVFTPSAPLTSNPWFPGSLNRDTLCADKCKCMFANMSFRKTFPSFPWSVPVAGCGLPPFALNQCPPFKFVGRLLCKGNCSFMGMSWKLTDPNSGFIVGSSNTSTFSINITPAMTQIPGVYTILLIGHCGTETCTCTVQFTVPTPCPGTCSCAQPAFTNAVNSGFSWLQLPNCQVQFTPKNLGPCDVVTWKRAPLGSSNFTTFGSPTTGNQPITIGFSNGGYTVCTTVSRTLPGGGSCQAVHCQTFNAFCEPLDEPPGGDASRSNACEGSTVENNGFVLGAEAGGLNDIGHADQWNASGGDPELAAETGYLDTNLVRLRGNGGYADLLYQDSLPVMAWDSVDLSLALRPISALIWPGTELVVRLSAQRQDSLWCSDDSTCLELMRLPIPQLDSSVWLLAGTYGLLKTKALPYLTIHVENPFIDDDVALKSVIDVDNICLSTYGISAAHETETPGLDIRLFPNPTTGDLMVQCSEPLAKGMTFRVIGLTGQVLFEQKAETGATHQVIHAGDLPSSLYFLQVMSTERVLAVKRFVKQ